MSSRALPYTGSCAGTWSLTKRGRSYAVYVDDPGDNLVLATALAGDADYLVTGDRRHLLHLKKVRRTRILTARELARRLDRRTGSGST